MTNCRASTPSPRVRGEGGVRGPLRRVRNCGAQNRGEAPSPSFAEPVIGPATSGRTRWLTRPLPACGERWKIVRTLLLIITPTLALISAARADEPFYQGKRVTLLVNFAPGGPTDVEGRLLAKHIVKHIDGNPLIIVQNKDGASGMVGSAYLGEVGPKDGTMFGYLTGTAWNSVIDPGAFRVDFRNYEFIGAQPGNAVYYMRSDTPPGMHVPADLMKAQGLIVGGLGADSSKDLLERLTFDMLGLQYGYVTGYRSSNTARLALQNGEINVHSESTPGYFSVVEPSLVKTGKVMPIWYDPNYDGKTFTPIKAMEHKDLATFPEFYKAVKGGEPSGPLWEAYKTNLLVDASMLRLVAMPPDSPPAAVAALRKALLELNDDKDYAADAMTAIQFVPHYEVGADLDRVVRDRLAISPEMRSFITGYMKKVAK
jgi:tripartite-type tricarboxylate transporter receptor subunit TctC